MTLPDPTPSETALSAALRELLDDYLAEHGPDGYPQPMPMAWRTVAHWLDVARAARPAAEPGLREALLALARMGAAFQHFERFGIMPAVPHGRGTWLECGNERCVAARELLASHAD